MLVLTGQVAAYEEKISELGLDPKRVTVTSADHDAMPQWLSLMHWGMLLLDPQSPAKRASMPTKLGEFFATGVRPVQFGCSTEVAQWVNRAGTGLALKAVDAQSLDEAAHFIATSALSDAALRQGRELTKGHFSLESGIARYDQVLSRSTRPD